MSKKILIISGSPKKDGNTTSLIEWFAEGARPKSAHLEIVHAAYLKSKTHGCLSCRACQKSDSYGCVVDDEVKGALSQMAQADVIVMATPLYFFGPSAQLKGVLDRMFSLYKWDNASGTMTTVLKGKTLVLLASAFEDVGLDILEAPFQLTADYSGMKFFSLVVAHAGVSGDIKKNPDARRRAVAIGEMVAG